MEICVASEVYSENEALVTFTIEKYFPWYLGDEDAAQIAKESLWKACLSYEEGPVKFSNYAITKIINDLRNVHRQKNYQKRKINEDTASLDSLVRDIETGERHIYPKSMTVYGQNVIWSNKKDFVELLTERQRKILPYILRGMSNVTIAPIFKVSYETIRKERAEMIQIFKDNIITI